MKEDLKENILEVQNLEMIFGGLTALTNTTFQVKRGTIKAIIGPNGAGKTNLYNIITGFLYPTKGSIRFNTEKISNLKTHEIAIRGISRSFQTIELFNNMTVLENVMVGCHSRIKSSFIGTGLGLGSVRKKEKQIKAKAMDILRFIGLSDKFNEMSDTLPLGEQKLLEIGRALATDPELICLDEPAAGLNETETHIASSLIKAIKEKGITVLLVEHDMKVVMNISDEIIVLNNGEVIAEGTPKEIQNNPIVIEAYLGDGTKHAEN
ncbi:MAG: ABC transporter ATP-binding protein [Desulfobacterales bacterium]|nr:ABC transporter ATP-binding protein [Desulfobacterales bacterium]